MRRTSPCTRIIGGRPEDKCRSDDLFFTTKASSSVRFITILPYGARRFFSSLVQAIMATIEENLQAVRARIGGEEQGVGPAFVFGSAADDPRAWQCAAHQ